MPLALVVEVPIIAAFFPGRRLQLALTCAAVNGLTYLVLHWVLGLLHWGSLPILVGEALATLAEAVAYAVASRQPGRSFVASAVANLASFVVGGL
ncbi:MAG TPA: hypothetical protein VFR85_01170 [Anaeromyxobacteraceae bacterium]|nr:hypothetical protein [Anaeromyxobacteraceae bacterium]